MMISKNVSVSVLNCFKNYDPYGLGLIFKVGVQAQASTEVWG